MPQFPQDALLLASSDLLWPLSLIRLWLGPISSSQSVITSSAALQCTRPSRGPPIILYKSPIAHLSSHFLALNISQTSQSHSIWCSSARLTFKSNFLANCDPAMSPRTPNIGVVDFGEEEIREQPRDSGKREFLVFLPNFASRKLMHKIAFGITHRNAGYGN